MVKLSKAWNAQRDKAFPAKNFYYTETITRNILGGKLSHLMFIQSKSHDLSVNKQDFVNFFTDTHSCNIVTLNLTDKIIAINWGVRYFVPGAITTTQLFIHASDVCKSDIIIYFSVNVRELQQY